MKRFNLLDYAYRRARQQIGGHRSFNLSYADLIRARRDLAQRDFVRDEIDAPPDYEETVEEEAERETGGGS